eukprot:2926340-Amphidinium_carterae.3
MAISCTFVQLVGCVGEGAAAGNFQSSVEVEVTLHCCASKRCATMSHVLPHTNSKSRTLPSWLHKCPPEPCARCRKRKSVHSPGRGKATE